MILKTKLLSLMRMFNHMLELEKQYDQLLEQAKGPHGFIIVTANTHQKLGYIFKELINVNSRISLEQLHILENMQYYIKTLPVEVQADLLSLVPVELSQFCGNKIVKVLRLAAKYKASGIIPANLVDERYGRLRDDFNVQNLENLVHPGFAAKSQPLGYHLHELVPFGDYRLPGMPQEGCLSFHDPEMIQSVHGALAEGFLRNVLKKWPELLYKPCIDWPTLAHARGENPWPTLAHARGENPTIDGFRYFYTQKPVEVPDTNPVLHFEFGWFLPVVTKKLATEHQNHLQSLIDRMDFISEFKNKRNFRWNITESTTGIFGTSESYAVAHAFIKAVTHAPFCHKLGNTSNFFNQLLTNSVNTITLEQTPTGLPCPPYTKTLPPMVINKICCTALGFAANFIGFAAINFDPTGLAEPLTGLFTGHTDGVTVIRDQVIGNIESYLNSREIETPEGLGYDTDTSSSSDEEDAPPGAGPAAGGPAPADEGAGPSTGSKRLRADDCPHEQAPAKKAREAFDQPPGNDQPDSGNDQPDSEPSGDRGKKRQREEDSCIEEPAAKRICRGFNNNQESTAAGSDSETAESEPARASHSSAKPGSAAGSETAKSEPAASESDPKPKRANGYGIWKNAIEPRIALSAIRSKFPGYKLTDIDWFKH